MDQDGLEGCFGYGVQRREGALRLEHPSAHSSLVANLSAAAAHDALTLITVIQQDHRLPQYGLSEKVTRASRKLRKERKNRAKKVRSLVPVTSVHS